MCLHWALASTSWSSQEAGCSTAGQGLSSESGFQCGTVPQHGGGAHAPAVHTGAFGCVCDSLRSGKQRNPDPINPNLKPSACARWRTRPSTAWWSPTRAARSSALSRSPRCARLIRPHARHQNVHSPVPCARWRPRTLLCMRACMAGHQLGCMPAAPVPACPRKDVRVQQFREGQPVPGLKQVLLAPMPALRLHAWWILTHWGEHLPSRLGVGGVGIPRE